jgi:hypothetical protein
MRCFSLLLNEFGITEGSRGKAQALEQPQIKGAVFL